MIFLSQPYSTDLYTNPFRDIFLFLDMHFKSCRYFNGFSIAKRPRRESDGHVIVRCSCGECINVSPSLWYIRVRGNIDIEDVIEDLNYQIIYQDRPSFNIKQHLNQCVELEIKKREFRAQYDAEWTCKEIQAKKSINPIFDLEV